MTIACHKCNFTSKSTKLLFCPSCGADFGGQNSSPISDVSSGYGDTQWKSSAHYSDGKISGLFRSEIFIDLFGFVGRINRSRYIIYTLSIFFLTKTIGLVIGFTYEGTILDFDIPVILRIFMTFLFFSAIVFLFWSDMSLSVKRLHDQNISGIHLIWIIFLPLAMVISGLSSDNDFLAIIGFMTFLSIRLWLFCAPGTPDVNRFGAPRS